MLMWHEHYFGEYFENKSRLTYFFYLKKAYIESKFYIWFLENLRKNMKKIKQKEKT